MVEFAPVCVQDTSSDNECVQTVSLAHLCLDLTHVSPVVAQVSGRAVTSVSSSGTCVYVARVALTSGNHQSGNRQQ